MPMLIRSHYNKLSLITCTCTSKQDIWFTFESDIRSWKLLLSNSSSIEGDTFLGQPEVFHIGGLPNTASQLCVIQSLNKIINITSFTHSHTHTHTLTLTLTHTGTQAHTYTHTCFLLYIFLAAGHMRGHQLSTTTCALMKRESPTPLLNHLRTSHTPLNL